MQPDQLLSNYQNDSEKEGRENTTPLNNPSCTLRLDRILTEAEMKSEDLELNGDEQRGLESCFMNQGDSTGLAIFIEEQIYFSSPESFHPFFSHSHPYKEMKRFWMH